jgi:hypothetical protein
MALPDTEGAVVVEPSVIGAGVLVDEAAGPHPARSTTASEMDPGRSIALSVSGIDGGVHDG